MGLTTMERAVAAGCVNYGRNTTQRAAAAGSTGVLAKRHKAAGAT